MGDANSPLPVAALRRDSATDGDSLSLSRFSTDAAKREQRPGEPDLSDLARFGAEKRGRPADRAALAICREIDVVVGAVLSFRLSPAVGSFAEILLGEHGASCCGGRCIGVVIAAAISNDSLISASPKRCNMTGPAPGAAFRIRWADVWEPRRTRSVSDPGRVSPAPFRHHSNADRAKSTSRDAPFHCVPESPKTAGNEPVHFPVVARVLAAALARESA